MDAVRFLEETRRMCRLLSHGACVGCPALINRQNCMFSDVIVNYGTKTTDAVSIVEKWSNEHSIKTRSSEFLKHYPNATTNNGAIYICPKLVDDSYVPCNGYGCSEIPCDDCKTEYWMQEVE